MTGKEHWKWQINGMKMMIKKILNKVICFIFGHDIATFSYTNAMKISLNRKGGKKRGKGNKTFKTRHRRRYCKRCGKAIK